MESSKGFIILHRKILDSPIWRCDEKYSKRDAWIELILMANHKDKEIFFDGQAMTVHRGQLLTSQRKLADRWKWHHCTVKRYIDMLKSSGMIQVDANTRATLISIVNYSKYQGFQHSAQHQCTTDEPLTSALTIHSRSTECPQTTMINNINNDNNVEQVKAAPPRDGGNWQ